MNKPYEWQLFYYRIGLIWNSRVFKIYASSFMVVANLYKICSSNKFIVQCEEVLIYPLR